MPRTRSRKVGRRHKSRRHSRRMRGGNEPMEAQTSMSPAPVGGRRRRGSRRSRKGGNLGLAGIIKTAAVPAALFYGLTKTKKSRRGRRRN